MSSNDTTYNGWTNYATWRINLEICADYLDSIAQDGTTFADVGTLSTHLSEYVDDIISAEGTAEGLAVDYARAFVSDVNWDEIARNHADDLDLIASDDEEEDEEA